MIRLSSLATILAAALLLAGPQPIASAQRSAGQAAEVIQPRPGSQAAVTKLISGLAKGTADYENMAPGLAAAVRQQMPKTKETIVAAGELKSLTFAGVSPQGADRFDATFERAEFIFDINVDPSGKLVGIRFKPADTPPPKPSPPSEAARVDDTVLRGYIRKRLEDLEFSGAVLVARDGKAVVEEVHGLADRENNVANTIDTRFRVGSMNKMMTAVAVMQLVQAGKVKLDAPLSTYLKSYPNQAFANAVTIHHLLTHTGGAGDFFGPEFDAKRLELKTLKDYVALFGNRPGEFAPGDNYRYANYGFILLGRVVEEASGESYYDYVADHIFRPAGMTRTGFEPIDVTIAGSSVGYFKKDGKLVANTDGLSYRPTSAGGGYSTARDWLAFANGLTNHVLLDAEHLQLLTSRKVSTGYAYGFIDFSTPEMRAFGHSGGAPGMNGDLMVFGDGKAVVITLSNLAPPPFAQMLSYEIIERLKVPKTNGEPVDIVRQPSRTPTASEEARIAAFKANDPDDDGKIDKAGYRFVLKTLGFADQLDPLFAQRDRNQDGFISETEYRLAIAADTAGPGVQ